MIGPSICLLCGLVPGIGLMIAARFYPGEMIGVGVRFVTGLGLCGLGVFTALVVAGFRLVGM